MRKQKLLKKSSRRGNLLAALLMVTASLLYSVTALAVDFRATYYFDNSATKWGSVYMIIGHGTYARAYQMDQVGSSSYYTHNVTDFTDATKFFFAESACGFSTSGSSITGGIDATPTCSNYTKKITTLPDKYTFVPSSSSGTNIEGDWTDGYNIQSVLTSSKIMFYLGEPTSYNNNLLFLYDNSNNLLCVSSSLVATNDSKRYRYAIATAASNYYFTHGDSWKSGPFDSTVPVQGGAYWGSGSLNITNDTPLTASVTFASGTITQGSNATISASSKSNGILGLTSQIKYYATTDNATFTELSVSESILQTSGLATGTWTIIPVFYDGHIYCKGTTTTLTVGPTGSAPTVLLGANPEVTDARATLHGYLKYTGCNDVTAFGFNWSTTQGDIDKDVPTGTAVAATSPAAPITVGNYGTEFELANYEFESNTTIYYKAYATNAVGTSYSAMGQFTTQGCEKPVINNITLSADPVCDNAVTITATADNITGATYAWEVDGTIFTAASGDTYQASITVGTAGTTGSISVTPTLAGCVGNKFTKSNIEVKSSAIAAKNLKVNDVSTTEGETINFCQGDEITFKITSDNKVDTYTWNFPEGWTIKSGSGTKEVVVTASATSGTVTATISNACGNSDARTIIANVTAIPATPGTITGDAAVCKQTDHTYTIEAVADATGYEWILPAGWSGTCGATGNILNARAGADAESGTIKVKATNSCGSSAYNTGKEVTVSGYSIVITGTGAKSAAATYPWELFNLTATTEASTITWNQTYTGTIAEDLTVFKSDGKTATLKSGAPVSDTDHYTVTASTNEGGCETTSDGYDVYINAAPVEECN